MAATDRVSEYDTSNPSHEDCPVVVGQQQGIGPGLFLICNRPLPCRLHEGRESRPAFTDREEAPE